MQPEIVVCHCPQIDGDRLRLFGFKPLEGCGQPILAGGKVVELEMPRLVGCDLTALVLRIQQRDLCARNHCAGRIENRPGNAAALGKLRTGVGRHSQREESQTERPEGQPGSQRNRLRRQAKSENSGGKGPREAEYD